MPSLENRVDELEKEIDHIKLRNKRVEADKAWEISKTRTAFVGSVTFLLIFFFMLLIKAENPFLNAFMSVVAYWISTETYGIFKKIWLKKRK